MLKLPIIQKCDILKEYCEFIAAVFRKRALLKSDSTEEEERAALEQAMNECIKKDILTDYLIRKGTEVINMFFGEYSYEEDVAAQREEAQEETKKETAIKMLKDNLPTDKVSQYSGLTLEKILELQKMMLENV